MPDSVCVVVDPLAGGGRGTRLWARYEKALRDRRCGVTAQVCDGAAAVADGIVAAARRGLSVIHVVGDTGTANVAANAMAATDRPAAELPAIAMLPVGAGTDFTRSLGYSGTPESIVAALAEGEDRLIDTVRVSFRTAAGERSDRCLVNTAGLGLSSSIAHRADTARLNRMLSSQLVFFFETLRTLVKYRFPRVRIAVDDLKPIGTIVAEVVVANGRFYGGGMAIAPDADIADGKFDVVVIRAHSKLQLIDQINRIYNGGHRNLPFVDFLRGARVTIESGSPTEPIGLVLDGIPVGQTPLVAEIAPRAFKVRAARRAAAFA